MNRSSTAPLFPAGEYAEQLSMMVGTSLVPVLLCVIPFGMVVAIHGVALTTPYGSEWLIGQLLGVALVRELSPCITAMMMAAQCGSAIASELGAMQVKDELDAMRVMGVRLGSFLLAPRIISMAVSCCFINAIAIVGGLAGGMVVMIGIRDLPMSLYSETIFAGLQPIDALATAVKASSYGAIIGAVACILGIRAKGGAEGVGRAVNATVVLSILLFMALNYGLTMLFTVALR